MDQCNDVLHKNERDGKNRSHFEDLAPNTMDFPIHDDFTCNLFFSETSVTSRRLFSGRQNTLILSCSSTAGFSTGNILKAETLSLGQQSPELGWLHSPFTVAYHHKGNSGGSTTTTHHSTTT